MCSRHLETGSISLVLSTGWVSGWVSETCIALSEQTHQGCWGTHRGPVTRHHHHHHIPLPTQLSQHHQRPVTSSPSLVGPPALREKIQVFLSKHYQNDKQFPPRAVRLLNKTPQPSPLPDHPVPTPHPLHNPTPDKNSEL